MIRACLFDLDGTLLPLDTDRFVEVYLRELAPYVAHVVPPDQLIPTIWRATKAMIEDEDPEKTNEEVFQHHFLSLTGLEKESIWPLFERFYKERFPELKKYTHPTDLARQVVRAALNRGCRVVVATNPVFPRVAIQERMRWAGVDDLPFEWVTYHEETRFCKPRIEYYRDIVDRMGLKPEECVMIGNDMQEDMVASTLGLSTYLVTDFRIDRGQPTYSVDQQGSLADLLRSIRNGEGVFSQTPVQPA